ncbi:hypothetical protein FIBSPDRAFT_735396 [Athelia psychrophila]|uniref:TPR-like protein n=1 Tax=Athelia psychrophila TaxID=1759441 RepID=A0A166N6K1_9AGAM|nr:hypothetical protein FIBSPDRAFT_735396 [Fibularhizoctonia sp. CBS 109695]
MSTSEHKFLFASLADKNPKIARQVHVRRLYDLLQLCLQRNDLPRAKRAWAILARCKEIDWRTMWTTGLQLLGDGFEGLESDSPRVNFLQSMMRQNEEDCEAILRELVLRLIMSGQHEEALAALDLYLPSFPYQDNPTLHIYAGLIRVYSAQPPVLEGSSEQASPFDAILLREAQSHFERARGLDPDNIVANAFLAKVPRPQSQTLIWVLIQCFRFP